MTSYITDLTDDLIEFAEEAEIISLNSEKIDQALELSQQLNKSTQQWQIYLQLLALFGFEDWLKKREPELTIIVEKASVMQPAYANILDVVCHLQVGEFKVCLIPTNYWSDSEVNVPRAILDLPEFTAHFYVIVGIDESLEVAAILGFIRYDQLNSYHPQLQPQIDWTYSLQKEWFNPQPDELLLYLQCLKPATIPLPAIPSTRQAELSQIRDELATQLLQLQSRPLWNSLSWEQGSVLLTHPELLNWLHHSNSENTPQQTTYLSDLLQILTQQALNVGQWLQSQVNELAQELSWQPLPMGVFRQNLTSSSPFEANIFNEIRDNFGVEIPEEAVGAYQDILNKIRLYPLSWSLADSQEEWTLFLIVTPIPGQPSLPEIELRISDQTGILAEEKLDSQHNQSYLLAQIEGTYDEKFLVTITTTDGEIQVSRLFEYRNSPNSEIIN
ncbi:DUF1822 family protein [Limnoraphis robusta Tam1]|uniref:DUF1822 family protein n=1 Tax=Limnoraphis robusta TaxID=1118279 RepID=UPI002B1EBEF6|nr:DUF1822 family protein [Limnoraphis robusta]MEA5500566.1 DUF1822 family protein [Limnoraphis robusta BA-68 BA1]MEA5541373.1 DUF1822 family protein [Limnoraphis robusta Tam1]